MEKIKGLNEAGKEEVALMIILWKDFKCDGKLDLDVTTQAIKFADLMGVRAQFEKMLSKVPPLKVVPRE